MVGDLPAGISAREAEVLDAVGAHLSNAQIAGRLHISVRTVESHVSALLRKLGVADRRELATLAPAAAVRAGAVMPEPWTSFVGRERERAAVLAALGTSRLVTLVGPGGVGKTRLAMEAARGAATPFPSGCAFVDLVPVCEGFVVQEVASVLGVAEGPQQPLLAAVLEHLAPLRVLLLLDNCEHVLMETAAFADRVLAACPGVRVLATSRERLAVAGEHAVPVPPLSVVAGACRETGSEAAALFTERARAVDPGFVAASGVDELCARLEGVPLAIELAAARCASLGVAGLLAAVDDYLRLLAGGRGADPRHHSLRAVIGWSHDLLDDQEREMFRGLGVFAGGFDLSAACAISHAATRGQFADLVGRLTDKSLLATAPGTGRWQMLATVRAYALEQLTMSGDEPSARERHLRWAAETAADIERRVRSGEPDQASWRPGFDAVAGDLRAALSGDVGGRLGEVRYALARSLGQLAYSCRYLAEARGHFARAAQLAPGAGQAAEDLLTQARVAAAEGRGELAFELLLASAGEARTADDDRARSEALAEAVTIAHRISGTFADPVTRSRLSELLAEALQIAPDADPDLAAQLAAAVAWNAGEETSTPDLRLAEAALAAARSAGDAVLISSCLDATAEAERAVGRYQRASQLSAERHRLVGGLSRHDIRAGYEISDSRSITLTVAAGDLPGALSMADPATSDPLVADQPMTLFRRVIPLTLRGEFDAALADVAGMWESWLRAGSSAGHWMAPAAYAAGLIHDLRGDNDSAGEWRDRAVRLAAGLCDKRTDFFAAFADARVALHRGQHDQAARAFAALSIGERPWYETARHWDYDAYAWALAAEAAVAASLPGASRLLASVAPTGRENLWAAACLSRANGRLHQDRAALDESLVGWERIGSRFERACTQLLIPELAAEGQAQLHALGCPMPAP
ncbi:MAG TPA: LuxR C-terminal-related transcriptional regulator [Streptosporangiaceae bacterium]